MNRELLKNYFIASLLLIVLIILFFAYAYGSSRLDSFGVDLQIAIGSAGIIMSGFFLISKMLGGVIPQLDSWGGVVMSMKNVGLASIFVHLISYWVLSLNTSLYAAFTTTPLISLPIIILLSAGVTLLVLYSDRLLQSKFPRLWQNLKYWEVFAILLLLLLLTVVDEFPGWSNWVKFILNIDTSLIRPLFPPPMFLTSVYGVATLFIYLWGYFTGSDDAGVTAPPVQPQVVPVPPIPVQPPPTPPTAPPVPDTPVKL